MDGGEARDEIVRLEAQIDHLRAVIENCRKFILAARIAIIGGTILFAVILFGVIRFDPGAMMASMAALLGGIAVWGSNASTAKQAASTLAAAEAHRAALIGLIDLRVVPERQALPAS